MKLNHIYNTDALSGIKLLKPLSIDCVVTSPPYWMLRSYLADDHELKASELGLESTPEEYIEKLCEIMHGFWGVMKSSGTMFVVLGDTYLGSGKGSGGKKCRSKCLESFHFKKLPKTKMGGWRKPKQLAMIPARFAIRMQELGWILRNQIIWHKPFCIPNNVQDRFCNDYETILFFSKSVKSYDFRQQLEAYTEKMNRWGGQKLKATGKSQWDEGTGQQTYRDRDMRPNPDGRIMRSVWSINPKPNDLSNTASYPTELAERMVVSGCPLGGVVVDPFMGAGTTAVVAYEQTRNFIGFEISEQSIGDTQIRLNLAKSSREYRRLAPPKFSR